jgi:hypothetical protein
MTQAPTRRGPFLQQIVNLSSWTGVVRLEAVLKNRVRRLATITIAAGLGCEPQEPQTAEDHETHAALPPECRRSFGKGMAAGFGALGAAVSKNGGRNEAVEEMNRSCDRALARQRDQQDRDLAREQLALERRRVELEERKLRELQELRKEQARQRARLEAPSATAPSSPGPNSNTPPKVLLFGGLQHDVYLGCICDDRERDSIFNEHGDFGSKYAKVSIHSKFAPFGSNYDDTSVCNSRALHPPVAVTFDGKFLGFLTTNTSLSNAITMPKLVDWLNRLCSE